MDKKSKDFIDMVKKRRKIEREAAYDCIDVIYNYPEKKVILKYKPKDKVVFEYDEEEWNDELEQWSYDLLEIKASAWNYYWDVMIEEGENNE